MEQPKLRGFEMLKPICDEIMQVPTIVSIHKLKPVVENLNDCALQDLQSYICFPFLVHLRRHDLSSDIKMEMVAVLQIVLKKTRINSLDLYFKIYTAVIRQIHDRSTPSLLASVSEELKLAVTECISLLTLKVSLDIIDALYEKDNAIQFCEGVYLFLQIAKSEKLRSLRVAALECIMILAYSHDEADLQDKVIRYQVADIFMLFLPGTLSGLVEIILGDVKQGHYVTSMAIKTWGRLLVLIFADDNMPELSENENESEAAEIDKKWIHGGPEGMRRHIKEMARTPKWYANTIRRFEDLLKELSPIVQHENFNVRLEIVKTCQHVLNTCLNSLKCIVHYFLEMLITLSEDEYTEVRSLSRHVLTQFSATYMLTFNKTLVEILEERYSKLLIKLPRIVTSSDTHEKVATMNLFTGYLRLFEMSTLPPIFDSPEHLEHLVSGLLCISQRDITDISLLSEYTLRDFESIGGLESPWNVFEHLQEQVLITKLHEIYIILAKSEARDSVIQYLLDRFSFDTENRKEIIYFLNEIASVQTGSLEDSLQIIENITELYQEQENWNLPIGLENTDVPLNTMKSNVVQICMITEGIGNFAITLQQSFQKFLLSILYFLLERAGSQQSLISIAGIKALDQVRIAMKLNTITELLRENADYLSHHIILKLRHVERHPGVLDVLAIIMRHCSMDILPCLQEIVSDVLLQSCDNFQERNSTSFIRVFHTFCICVLRWQKENPKTDDVGKENLDELSTEDRLKEATKILDEGEKYNQERLNKSAEELYKEDLKEMEESELNSDQVDEVADVEIPIPLEVNLTSDIIKRCLNFLPSKNRSRKILVLDTLSLGIEIVQHWDNVLLRLVHLIWSPLVQRFKETTDPLIINRSVLLLFTLAKTSKDFIRHRVTKEVVTDLCKILHTSAEHSKFQDRGAAYRYSQEFKLQLCLLDHLAEIIKCIDVVDEVLQKTSLAAIPYLSCNQPLSLQMACLNYYRTLMGVNKTIVQQSLKDWTEKNTGQEDLFMNLKQLI